MPPSSIDLYQWGFRFFEVKTPCHCESAAIQEKLYHSLWIASSKPRNDENTLLNAEIISASHRLCDSETSSTTVRDKFQ
jgi:hypothetical protein